jgi:DNA-binding HxlR family transcriptional regulator
MTTTDSPNSKIFSYTASTVERAERSLVCSPFTPALLAAMSQQSVSLSAIAQDSGIKSGYTKHLLSELACDNALDWLIQVGVLRREVDGQGITDSYRLTPLGQQLAEKYENKNWPQPSWSDRLQNNLTRWLRLPF